MRVALLTHIGETYGHLVRGLALADEIAARGAEVEFVSSAAAVDFLRANGAPYPVSVVPWSWSHNSRTRDGERWLDGVLRTNEALSAYLAEDPPDLAVGLPGVFTVQVARAHDVPHVSVLHGPYLSPLVDDSGLDDLERRVIAAGRAFFEDVNGVYSRLADELSFGPLTYERYLETEQIYIPQPDLPLPDRTNLHVASFISASYGFPYSGPRGDLERAVFVTFGSGNPCDITQIVEAAADVFPRVIVATGRYPLRRFRGNVHAQPSVASADLAGRVGALVSHGGIGTVGTFAAHGTPQLIVPTEVDQATMAVWAHRSGLASRLGLEAWRTRPQLGRMLPELRRDELVASLVRLRDDVSRPPRLPGDGAAQLADAIARTAAGQALARA